MPGDGHVTVARADAEESPAVDDLPRQAGRTRTWLPDLLGLAWVLAAAAAVMGPALVHGLSLGPFDLLSKHGLTTQPGVVHNPKTSDQIQLFIPWTALAWTQVHSGHLPLWNQYSVLGMPLAFNWESAPFALPSLVGYLVPLRLAYTVGVLVTLVIAGTGVYVLGRIMDLGVFGCVMAATVYELSGRFMVTLGWSLGSVMSWAGWMFAIGILVLRGRHRTRDSALLAVIVAMAVYSGYPEGTVILVAALVLFLIVQLLLRTPRLHGSGPILRPIGDLVVAGVAGVALSAPLVLPGLQVAAGSNRNGQLGSQLQTIGSGYFVNFIVQGFDGLPWYGSHFFGPHTVGSTLIYVGVIATMLAVLAVGVRWRRPEVLGFVGVAVVSAALVFSGSLASVIDHLPGVGSVRLYDALAPLTLAVAALAGVGTDALVRWHGRRVVQYWAGAGFSVIGLVLLVLWTVGRGHLDPADASIRARSFVWPAIETAVGLAVVGVLVWTRRRHLATSPVGRSPRWSAGRWAALVLLTFETAFLIAAGAPTFSSSSTGLTATQSVVGLKHAVGASVVGFGSPCLPSESLGIIPNVNAAFGVQEFAVYDPIVPHSYFQSWSDATGESLQSGRAPSDTFCPAVRTAATARLFGIQFVLEHPGAAGPRGGVFDGRVGAEDLYRIPGAAEATLSPVTPGGRLPGNDARGAPVAVTHPGPASWRLATDASSPEVLRLRLTNVPGWHATIDGHPLRLLAFDSVMLQARIPPGHHTIELHYWPTTFTVGIVVAAVAALGLLFVLVLGAVRRRAAHHLSS